MKKKILAIALCATMAFGTTMVYAADTDVSSEGDATNSGSALEGDGLVEGYLSSDVFKVTLPTTTDAGIEMTLDPQGLLNVIDNGKYSTGDGAIYFPGATDNTKSDDIVVKNKSSFKVDVELDVAVTTGDKITLVDDSAKLADATTPSMYLEITDDASAPNVKALADATKVSTTLDAIEYEIKTADSATDGYTQSKTEPGKYYAYLPKSASDAETVTYNISGSCDSTADWSGAVDETPSISVTWTVKKHAEAPAATNIYANYNNGAFWINTTSDGVGAFTEASKISNVKIAEGEGEANSVEYSLASNWVKISWNQAAAAGATWNGTGANDYTITFTYDGVNYIATCQAGKTAQ